jgi:alginate O-acetyltransferase complex protein AlgJ
MRPDRKWTWVVAALLVVAGCSTKQAEPEAVPPGPSHGPADAAKEADRPATEEAAPAATKEAVPALKAEAVPTPAKEAEPTPAHEVAPPAAEEAVPDATEEPDEPATGDAVPDVAKAFRAECGEKAEAAEIMTVRGRDGWLFLKNELRHVSVGRFWGEDAARVSRAAKPEHADPLPAILDYKARLDELGIELIVVPVPPKVVVYPDKLADSVAVGKNGLPPRLDAPHQEFYRLLREKGVNVIDLAPAFAAARAEGDTAYCRHDTHWSGTSCVRTARLLAEEIRRRPWYAGIPRSEYKTEEKPVEISGDLWRALGDDTIPRETLTLRTVGAGSDDELADRDSPVVLMGDSHCLIFHAGGDMLARGAGLADQLAFELGFPVNLLGVRGSGARPARVALYRRGRKEGYLAKKKLVIWCFSAREFTEANGWGEVPVAKVKRK